MLRNRSFRLKLIATTVAPITVLLAFTYLLVSPRLVESRTASQNKVDAQHVQLLARLSAALQEERDLSAWYVASKANEDLGAQMLKARTTTDSLKTELLIFEESLPVEFRWASGQMDGSISDLETPRNNVDRDNPDVLTTVETYTTRINSLTSATRSLGSTSSNAELAREASALSELVVARSRLSLLRAETVSRLENRTLLQRDLGLLQGLNASAQAAIERYKSVANQADVASMTGAMTDSNETVDPGQRTFQLLITDLSAARPTKVEAAKFWEDQAPLLNRLTSFTNTRVTAFETLSAKKAASARQSVITFATAAAMAVLSSALISLMLARSLGRRLTNMASQARTIATEELPEVLKALRNPTAEAVAGALPTVRSEVNDELGMMADAFNNVLHTSVRTSLEHSYQRAQTVTTMLVNLGRRNQSLIDRQLKIMDRLEAREEDPEVLEALYEVDHLVTRMRRNAENLLVLSGQKQARTWSKPVSLYDVLRSAAAEVSDLNRVEIAENPQSLTMSGPFAVDACHLLAELVENATRYSPKTTTVSLSSMVVGDHVVVSVLDGGVGMNDDELADANERLAHPPEIDELVADRVGFQVVGRLARKINASVLLRANSGGGTIADVKLPTSMFIEMAAQSTAPSSERTPNPSLSMAGAPDSSERAKRAPLKAVPASRADQPGERPGAPTIGSKKVGLRDESQRSIASHETTVNARLAPQGPGTSRPSASPEPVSAELPSRGRPVAPVSAPSSSPSSSPLGSPVGAPASAPVSAPANASAGASPDLAQPSIPRSTAASLASSAPTVKPTPAEAVLMDAELLLGSPAPVQRIEAPLPSRTPTVHAPAAVAEIPVVTATPVGAVADATVPSPIAPMSLTPVAPRPVATAPDVAAPVVAAPVVAAPVVAAPVAAEPLPTRAADPAPVSQDLPQRSVERSAARPAGFDRLPTATTSGSVVAPVSVADSMPAAKRSSAFAAVQQAKRAVEEHVANSEQVAVSVGAAGATTEDESTLAAVAAPVANAVAPEAVPAPTVSPDGLIQRRPGKVFSSAAEAADRGAFKRLGDGSTKAEEQGGPSRFAALSKLQRGVAGARTDTPAESGKTDGE
jgi:signal transduction histidine kinase